MTAVAFHDRDHFRIVAHKASKLGRRSALQSIKTLFEQEFVFLNHNVGARALFH